MKEKARTLKIFYDQYKILIVPVLVGVSSLFLVLFVIVPQLQSFLGGRATLQETEENLKILTVKAGGLESINEDDLRKKLAVALSALPPERDFAKAIGILQDVAALSGVSLSSIQIGQAQAESGSGFSVKVELVASKLTMAHFLRQVESAPRVMKVQGLDLAFSRTGEGIDAAVVLEVFFAPAPQALGAVTDSLPQISPEDEKVLLTLSNAPVATFSATPSSPRGKPNPFD